MRLFAAKGSHIRLRIAVAMGLAFGACESAGRVPNASASESSVVCADVAVASERAPDVEPYHELAPFWLARLPAAANTVRLDARGIDEIAQQSRRLAGGTRDLVAPALGDRARIEHELAERREWLQARLLNGAYVQGREHTLRDAYRRVDASRPTDRLHVVIHETPLWCVPTKQGLYSPPIDHDFDRNRCSSVHAGEGIRVLLEHDDGWLYVHTGHAVGWLHEPVLSPALRRERFHAAVSPAQSLVVTYDRSQLTRPYPIDPAESLLPNVAPAGFRLGARLPLVDSQVSRFVVQTMTTQGPEPRAIVRSDAVHVGPLPFRPAEVIRVALDHIGLRYGWGGTRGDYDCSRFLYDLFRVFGIDLARHSAVQARLGTRTQSLRDLDEAAKREAIRTAAREGVVLLYMPGHIMMYLGEDGDHMYAVSAISEYLEPCRAGQDVVRRLDRVAVTTLELGRGTERTAFIERLSQLAVFGEGPRGSQREDSWPPIP